MQMRLVNTWMLTKYLALLIVDESLFDFLHYTQKEGTSRRSHEQVKKAAEFPPVVVLIEIVQDQTDRMEKPKTDRGNTEVVR